MRLNALVSDASDMLIVVAFISLTGAEVLVIVVVCMRFMFYLMCAIVTF